MRAWLILIILACAATAAALRGGEPAAVTPAGVAAPAPGSPPAPVYSPAESLGLFQIQSGFRIELFAAEPMVEAPVAMNFDEDGRLWVVEMLGYMPDVEGSGELEPSCRIAVLEDTDGDGKADKRTVFMDKLVLPRCVLPCYGGALVMTPPDIVFAKDTDGDGVADQKNVLTTGLGGRINPEHAPNSLTLGMDNWIHLSQAQLEYRFDGTRLETRATPGHGQWGLTQDEAGRLYYLPNSDTLRGDYFPKHYAARNGEVRSVAGMNEVIGRDTTVWPARPTPGVNRGYQPGTLRPDGTLANHTAACAPVVYDSRVFGPEARGDVFTCEPAAFMVRRLKLREKNGRPDALNAYDKTEFLRSTDERFRPVNLAVGPDGALYVADMYRGVIQHRTYVTMYLREQIKARSLEKPLGMGRIYRVLPAKEPTRPTVALSKLSDEALVSLLQADTDAWYRRTCHRLLVERRAMAAAEKLTGVVGGTPDWPTRLHALWTLEGLGQLTWEKVRPVFEDRDPPMRAAAVRVSEPWISRDDVFQALRDRLKDADPAVRLQAALSIGERRDEQGLSVLAELANQRGDDALMRSAILTGVAEREAALLRLIVGERGTPLSKGALAVAGEAAEIVLRRSSAADRAWVISLAGGDDKGLAAEVVKRAARVQRVDTPKPSVIELASEPRGWSAVAAGSIKQAKEVDSFLAWPGRPAPGRATAEVRPLTKAEQQRFRRGEELFTTAGCTGCHTLAGTGTTGQIPSLVGSSRVLGSENRLARILLYGAQGVWFSEGTEYNGIMPAAPVTSDGDIASLMTFIRRSWGNTADPVTVQTVERNRRETRGRKYPWRADEIDGVR